MSTSDQQPSEEELRAAYEAEIKKIRVEQIVLEQVVSLVNLGMRRTGLQPGTEDERDPDQVRVAIEAVRALLPLVDQAAPPQANAIREALSQMQLAYLRIGGKPGEAGTPEGAQPPAGPGAGAAGAGAAGGPGTPAGGGTAEPAGAPRTPPADPATPGQGDAGPAQRSGRLWIPGQ